MQTLILLCTLATLAGLPAGYWLAWLVEALPAILQRSLDSYLGDDAALWAWTWEVRP